MRKYNAISLFSGAGGMDIGFEKAGFNILAASEMDNNAIKTYEKNNPQVKLYKGDLHDYLDEISSTNSVDLVFGGPPCQGFSVAGKMDPNDPRSELIWRFMDVVERTNPKAFVIENVKALGKLAKWEGVRDRIIERANELGFSTDYIILDSSDFGVPQRRERVFFVGVRDVDITNESLSIMLDKHKKEAMSVRETIKHLGRAGTDMNPHTCQAKITFASNPIMRKSPYAGMLFNGMGRPLNLDVVSTTLPASMGGNKTPIVDEELLYNEHANNWIEEYHSGLRNGTITPSYNNAPNRLRRLTLKEAALIQSFPVEYEFYGSKSAVYKQIGNAVPCGLAEAVANAVKEILDKRVSNSIDELEFAI
jgi:DNA (cytosine-5)-methyltransferase 1